MFPVTQTISGSSEKLGRVLDCDAMFQKHTVRYTEEVEFAIKTGTLLPLVVLCFSSNLNAYSKLYEIIKDICCYPRQMLITEHKLEHIMP